MSTLVERLKAAAIDADARGYLRHADLLREAAAAQRAADDLCKANAAIVDEIREVVGLKGKPGSVVDAVKALRATTGEGEWADEELARHWIDRYAAGIDPEPQMDRILECAAHPPSLRDATINPTEIDSKLIEPLRTGVFRGPHKTCERCGEPWLFHDADDNCPKKAEPLRDAGAVAWMRRWEAGHKPWTWRLVDYDGAACDGIGNYLPIYFHPAPAQVDEALMADLSDYLRGCPDPDKTWPQWMVKKASRLLWRCRAALTAAAQEGKS